MNSMKNSYQKRIDLNKKEECCGCSACKDICPKNAINMVPDKEGFFYPQIDETRCIECGICKRVCVFSSEYVNKFPIYDMSYDVPLTYGAKNKDEYTRARSRSGGVFTSLSDAVLEKGGIIYGCGMDKAFRIFHMRGTTKEMRNEFRGSKYCQSDTQYIFRKIEADLKANKHVMFSGTSCQTAALRAFLNVGGG